MLNEKVNHISISCLLYRSQWAYGTDQASANNHHDPHRLLNSGAGAFLWSSFEKGHSDMSLDDKVWRMKEIRCDEEIDVTVQTCFERFLTTFERRFKYLINAVFCFLRFLLDKNGEFITLRKTKEEITFCSTRILFS